MVEEKEAVVEPEMSDDEMAERLSQLVGTSPVADEKDNVHTFLRKVAEASDTVKTGNLEKEELGQPQLNVRAYKSLALISNKIMGNDYFKEFFDMESEIVTGSSLSKEGFLDKLAITSNRQIEDVTRPKKENKGWFKSNKTPTPPTQ